MKMRVVRCKKNLGHGYARRKAISCCSNELIAIMDADDVCDENRFKKQLFYFSRYPETEVLGGQIYEFIDSVDNIVAKREVLLKNNDIRKDLKKRCPFNQMTVMMRKTALEKAGGYKNWFCNEDYYLWVRMYEKEVIFANLEDTLVYTRVGEDMYKRRGGWKYFCSELRLQKYMYKQGIISQARFVYNVAIRLFGEVFCPSFFKGFLFSFIRKRPNIEEKRDGMFDNGYESENNIKFSLAMCVYGGDNPIWFDEALASIFYQSVRPDEIILVVDGPVSESINNVISKYRRMTFEE